MFQQKKTGHKKDLPMNYMIKNNKNVYKYGEAFLHSLASRKFSYAVICEHIDASLYAYSFNFKNKQYV